MMRLGELAGAVEGRSLPGERDRVITDCVIDSRKVSEGSLFFALKGENTDGHMFVDDVLEKGGMAVVSHGEVSQGLVVVDSVEKALMDAAGWRRDQIGSEIVALTGSSGKTTTRRLLSAMLETEFSVYSTSGNLNNHIGMPLTILNSPEVDRDFIVLELGMNHSGELLVLGGTARPDHCLVTNIGRAHMEFFDSLEDVARAKSELIRMTSPGGCCVIPMDEDILREAAHEMKLRTRYFGTGGDLWFRCEEGRCIVYPWDLELSLDLKGIHNVQNAVAAALMATNLGVSPGNALEAASGVPAYGGRGRVLDLGSIVILDESYNANPDSTLACLNVLDSIPGRRGAVLGDMRELGESAPELHREILRRADGLGLDFLILTGSIYRSVMDTVKGTRVDAAEDWREALQILRSMPEGFTVLVKGSNSLRLGELVRAMEEGV